MHRLVDLPPVTDAHRQAAFQAMHWAGWTYPAAMANDTRRRVVEARAAHMRTQDWLSHQTRTTVPVHRCRLGVDGHPLGWCTQRAAGALAGGDLLTTTSESRTP